MPNRHPLFAVAFLMVALFLVGCSSTSAAPAVNQPAAANQAQQSAGQNKVKPPAPDSAAGPDVAFKTETVDGGSVSVAVTPVVLHAGAAPEFEIAMNTHSVDLSDDMLKAVVLHDDTGKEYAPSAWDGPAAGGHHRSGKITFAALSASTKSVTLIVKGIAGIPERTYKWDLS